MAEEDALGFLDKSATDPDSGWISDDDVKAAISQVYFDHPDDTEVDGAIDLKLEAPLDRITALELDAEVSPIQVITAVPVDPTEFPTADWSGLTRTLELGIPGGPKGDKGERGQTAYTFLFQGAADVDSPDDLLNTVRFPLGAQSPLWVLRYTGNDVSWADTLPPELWAFSPLPLEPSTTPSRPETVLVNVSSNIAVGAALSFVEDTVTIAGHGLGTSDRVLISNLVDTTGLTTDTIYWVVEPDTNTFKLSETQEGAPIDFGTVDGTADVDQVLGGWHYLGASGEGGSGGLDPADLAAHSADTTDVHGIADTSLLATKSYADSSSTTAATSAAAPKIDKTIVDAKGDLIAASAADTVLRVAVGTDGQVLTADSAEAAGVIWADPTGGVAPYVDPFAYWDEVEGSWPARPAVEAGHHVEWRSVLDTEAPPPANALPGDSWKRAPGASF